MADYQKGAKALHSPSYQFFSQCNTMFLASSSTKSMLSSTSFILKRNLMHSIGKYEPTESQKYGDHN